MTFGRQIDRDFVWDLRGCSSKARRKGRIAGWKLVMLQTVW
jgi:hypothetical protein